MDHIEEA